MYYSASLVPYPGCPPPNCWHRSAISMRKVLRTKSWSLLSCCTSGSADSPLTETGPMAMVMVVNVFVCPAAIGAQGSVFIFLVLAVFVAHPEYNPQSGNMKHVRIRQSEALATTSGIVYNRPQSDIILCISTAQRFMGTFSFLFSLITYYREPAFSAQSPVASTMAPSIATPPVVPSKPDTIATPLPNPSLQVTADHQLKQVDAPVYAPKRGEVLLQIKATGICGYVKCYLHGRNICADS